VVSLDGITQVGTQHVMTLIVSIVPILRTAHQTTMVKARKHNKPYDEFQSEPTVEVSQVGAITKITIVSQLYREGG
jgi:hypothetical protein